MSENWMPILRHDESGPRSLMTNVRFRDEGSSPDPTRPLAVCVNLPFQNPDDHGMGETSEMELIDREIDRLALRILSEASGVYVGRVRGQGRVRLWFYAPESSQHAIETLARAAFKSRVIGFEIHRDPQWSNYQAMLPSDDEHQRVMDQMVINQLAQHGDPLSVPRDVQHFAYFGDDASARQFADKLKMEGFRITIEEAAEPAPGAEICVIANRDDPATPEAIMPITSRLLALAKEHGGVYDGWEAQLIRKRGGLAGLVSRLIGRR